MKKRILALALAIITVVLSSCAGKGSSAVSTVDPHVHVFDQKVATEEYLRSEATCRSKNRYYLSCVCGEKGTATFGEGEKKGHDYSAEVVKEEYFVSDATCLHGKAYSLSCTVCGEASDVEVFYSGETAEHVFTQAKPDGRYIFKEATASTAPEYYHSCKVCGEKGSTSFSYGEPLRSYTEAERNGRLPVSVTVSLYDSENTVYGFTCNTALEPLRPVIQLSCGGQSVEYPCSVTKETSFDENDGVMTYYIIKAEVPLAAGSTYTYRIYDKYVQVGSDTYTLTAVDSRSDSFTFAHVSDSQSSGGAMGVPFGQVLSFIYKNVDFAVHTGDMVEWSKYEHEWKWMLDDNARYLTSLPLMAISGNHETTYQNGKNETFKHFNYSIPNQSSTSAGFFYSFVYGNMKFIMLNTNDLTSNKLKNDQLYWLQRELKDNDSLWTVVSLHNPLYSAGPWGADTSRNQISLALRSQLADIFAEYGVDIVLQGHDHCISKTFPIGEGSEVGSEEIVVEDGIEYTVDPDGVIYVMNGPSGNHNRNTHKIDKDIFDYAMSSSSPSWAEITVDGSRLTVTVKKINGERTQTVKEWGIIKTAE